MKNEYADIKLPVSVQFKDGSIDADSDDALPFLSTRERLVSKVRCCAATFSSVEMDATPEELAELSDSELVQKWADLISQNPNENESRFFARFVSYEEALTLCGFDFEKHLNCLEDYEYYWSNYGPGSSYWDEGFGEYVVKFLKLVDPKLLEGKIPSREEAKRKSEEDRRKSEAQNLLLAAIRQRDAKAEAERLAAEKKEQEFQKNHRKLTNFLADIGDFVVSRSGSSPATIRDLWVEREDLRIILRDLSDKQVVCLVPADGFEKNKQRIIKWAVDLGAKEPEPAIL